MKLEIQEHVLYTEMRSVCGQSKYTGLYALAEVGNALAAKATATETAKIKMEVKVEIPPHVYKSRVNAMEKQIREACEETGIELLKLEEETNPALRIPCVTAAGALEAKKSREEAPFEPGQEIVLAKWVGLAGMLRIADEKEKELLQKLSPAFIRQIRSYRKEIFSLEAIRLAKEAGAAVRQIEKGGILAALWELALETGTGLKLLMPQFSILQETVEVCEHFRLNPYQMTAVGSFLAVTDNGKRLVEELEGIGVRAELIGWLTDNRDKVIQNGEEVRYIDRPAPDEILKIYE